MSYHEYMNLGIPEDFAKWEDDADRIVQTLRSPLSPPDARVRMDCFNLEDRQEIERRVRLRVTPDEERRVFYTWISRFGP